MAGHNEDHVSDRGTYSTQGGSTPTALKIAGISLAIVGVMLAPVIAIVGGAALASAVGGRGGKR